MEVKFQPYESGRWHWLIAKPLIIFTSSGWKYALSKSVFQDRSTEFMRCSTFKVGFKIWFWFFGIVDLEWGAEIQGSFNIEMDWPSPLFSLTLFNQISGWVDTSPTKRWWWRSMMIQRIRFPKISSFAKIGLSIRRQNCFANKAVLKSWRS